MRAVMFASDKGDLPFNMPLTNNFSATTDPTAANDSTQKYEPGSQWINQAAGRAWVCLSNAIGAAVWSLDSTGNITTQAAQVVQDTAATLTGANLLVGLIQSSPAGAINLQLPLASGMDSAIGATAPNNTSVDFSIINTSGGANAVTVTTNTGWTLVGSVSIAQNVSARFRARKTGAGAWTLYRIS